MSWNEEKIKEWLLNNAPHIKLLKWSGFTTTIKSKFIDVNRNVEFEYSFHSLRKRIKENPNTFFASSKDERLEKTKKTWLEKYGGHPSQSTKIRKKIKQTNLERYGVVAPAQNKEIQAKIEKTNLQRYGVKSTAEVLEFKAKKENTCLDRYGVKHPLSNKEIRKKAKQTLLKNYNVEYPLQNKNIKEKTKQTNLQRYGTENPLQNFTILKKMLLTKSNNGTISMFDGKTLSQLAKEKNCSYMTAWRLHSQNDRKEFIKLIENFETNKSSLEQIIEQFLIQENIQYISQKYWSEEKIFSDFVLPDHHLVIECDGLYYHSEIFRDKNYHKNRRKFYEFQGLKLLHFYGDEIINNIDDVKKRIMLAINDGIIINSQPEDKFFWTNNNIRLESYEFSNDKEAALKGFVKLWGYE